LVALPAHRVATPVLERIAGAPGTVGRVGGAGSAGPVGPEVRGRVLGVGATAAWVDLDGFVVAVTTREVPLLPNAVALAAGSGALAGTGVRAGAAARLAPGRVELGGVRVAWDPAAPPSWDPAVPVPADAGPETVLRRGTALLRALGVRPDPAATDGSSGPVELVRDLAGVGLATAVDPDGATALAGLLGAVRDRDPGPAVEAVGGLLGRGPGLTPEGDDLVAAVAGTLAVLGPAAGLREPALGALLAALAPEPGRTTALSATLLELAAQRRLVEPAGRLLDLGPTGEAAWPAALRRLERLGHGSGRAYAAGIAATASLLAAGRPLP
jgi:Protein of unknown function (DUF2877)